MATLSDEVKTFIVHQLAMYDTPSQVSAAVKERFDLDVPRNHIAFYDPATGRPGKKWKAIFAATRENFLKSAGDIPIAQRAVRLRRLDRMATKLEETGNRKAAAALLEQAAKDAGGAFTNRRELSGPKGAPLAPGTQVWIVGGKEVRF